MFGRVFRLSSLLLLISLGGCEKPKNMQNLPSCDIECSKCIKECHKDCDSALQFCLKSANPFNRSSFENCPFYAQQCALDCLGKCISSPEKKE
jgi:hypothetical protein